MKISLSQKKIKRLRWGILGLTAAVFLGAASASHAGTATTVAPTEEAATESIFESWWNGKYMTGNWFGLRDTLADNGIKFNGKYTGVFYGVIDSERGERGFWDQELAFGAEVDFAKLTKWEGLDGLKGFGGVRWRDPRAASNPNQFVLASGNFQPSHFQSGTQWRLITFGLEYATPELFGVKDFITLRGGWLPPQREFVDQPLSKQFVNASFETSKGLGANIPWSASFSTWGGTLKVKPVESVYVKGGLFMSYPNSTVSSNHGLAFEGYGPDPSLNGLFAIGEVGYTPKLGDAELPGKYAAGAYYYGQWGKSFNGYSYPGKYGFYWQADQMLFREPTPQEEPAPMGKGPSDGKTTLATPSVGATDGKSFKEVKEVKEVAPAAKPKLSEQGLYMFNLVTYAPKYNNILPFYFHTGLVYKGLIPGRDKDQTMFAVSYGQYSFYNVEALQRSGRTNQPNYSLALEWDYRVQINDWAYVQPYAQYIIQPNGTGAVENAAVLGFMTGVVF